jgi:hypothetical protein
MKGISWLVEKLFAKLWTTVKVWRLTLSSSERSLLHGVETVKYALCDIWEISQIRNFVLDLSYYGVTPDDRFRSKHVACWQRIKSVVLDGSACTYTEIHFRPWICFGRKMNEYSHESSSACAKYLGNLFLRKVTSVKKKCFKNNQPTNKMLYYVPLISSTLIRHVFTFLLLMQTSEEFLQWWLKCATEIFFSTLLECLRIAEHTISLRIKYR